MSHTFIHICNLLLHLTQNLIQNQKTVKSILFIESLHLLLPFSVELLFGLNINLVYQMFVIGSIGDFVAGGIVSFMAFDSFGSGDAGSLASEVAVHPVAVVGFSVVVAVHLVPECLGYFVEFVFDDYHPSLPLYFYKWGNLVPIHISLPLVLQWHWGFPVLGAVALSLWGVEIIAGGIGQSLLNSNKFPDIFPALGHGVPAQVRILLSGEGLLSDILCCGGFSFYEFIEALGAVVGDCAVVLLVLGMSFLLLSVTFVSFLMRGLVLGWVDLE